MAEALRLAGDSPMGVLEAAKSDLLDAFAPVPPASSAQHAEWRKAIGARLDSLAAKIAPTMSVGQGTAWRKSVTDALADLPAMIGLTAAKRAIHQPMSFIGDVDGVVRTLAGQIADERREAIARIERLMAELSRPPAPALSPPDRDVEPAEIAASIARVTNPTLKQVLRDTARAAGWMPPADDKAPA